MCQAYVCMCKVLMHIYFYSHLHATLGAFYVHFVVNIYLSGTSHIHICQLELWFYIHVHVATHWIMYSWVQFKPLCFDAFVQYFNHFNFFYYFQGIRGHWIIPGLKESRRVIIEEGNWALFSLVLWKQIQTKKIQGRCIVFFIKKIVIVWTVFLDAYQQCFLTQYFAFTFVMNAVITQTKKLLCTLNLNYMCNKKWVVGLSWGKRKERKTWVMNIKFQLQTTVSNFLVDIGVPVLS